MGWCLLCAAKDLGQQALATSLLCEGCDAYMMSYKMAQIFTIRWHDMPPDLPPILVVPLFSYHGTLRELILRAKIQACRAAAHILREMFLRELRSLSLVELVSSCAPLPSSLWSKVRGRFHLSLYLAEVAQKNFQWTVRSPFTWGQLRKRSMRRARPSLFILEKTAQESLRGQVIHPQACLDDVLTTGATLRKFLCNSRDYPARGGAILFFCLASAVADTNIR